MNTLEILYQAFRVRYSLNQLQQILDRGCRLAVLAPGSSAVTIREFLGEPILGIDERHPQDDLIEISMSSGELSEEDVKELRTCDACVVYFPDGPPDVETLEEIAGKIPLHIKTLWLCDSDGETAPARTYHERDLTLPTVRSLPKNQADAHFLRLLLASLPQVSLVLARDWSKLREVFCQTLTRRTALRNGVRAGISSLPLRAVPVVGPLLSMLATSAETMMLTSSQLRLSFVIAAVHGRPIDFFDRISELWPIVGSAFGFRGVSRALGKFLPGGFRPGMKASIAFAGTFAVGEASRMFYHLGRPSSDEVRRELLRRAEEEGAKEAQLLFRRILAGQSIDEVGVGGTEVIDLVEGLTTLEQVIADPIMGGALAEAQDHEEALLREAVAQEMAQESSVAEAEKQLELENESALVSVEGEGATTAVATPTEKHDEPTGIAALAEVEAELAGENEASPSLEPTVEMDAVAAEAPSEETAAAEDSASSKGEVEAAKPRPSKGKGRKGKRKSDSGKDSDQA